MMDAGHLRECCVVHLQGCHIFVHVVWQLLLDVLGELLQKLSADNKRYCVRKHCDDKL